MFSSQGRAPSDLKEIEEAIERRDGPLLTRKLDQKCRLIRSYGLQRWDKVDITKLKKFNLKEDLPPQLEPLWAELSGAQGGFELEQWTYEVLCMDHGLHPPRKFTETMSHEFSLRDADSATPEAMLAINAPDEDLDDARAYADTARHDDPNGWTIGTEVEIFYEKQVPESEGSPPTGRWHFEDTIFVQVDQMHHPGYIYVLNKRDGEADWVALDQVRRRLVTPN